jgi:ankyrin repeat protein
MQSDNDNTALIKACRRGDVERVRELLDKGIYIDYTDKVPHNIIIESIMVCSMHA